MSRSLPTLEEIVENPQAIPSDLRSWIRTYHSGSPYSSQPLGVRDPEISRFLMYYAVYAKIFLTENQTPYDLPAVNLKRIASKREFLDTLRNEGHLCGSGQYRPNGFLDDVGSAFSDLGSTISRFAGSVLDYLIPTGESFVSFANRKIEQYLLDGTAARGLGALLALTPCGAICYGAGESIAQAQSWINDQDYFGQKPSDFVNIAYFFDGDKSRPIPPDRRSYQYYCWRLPDNFTFGLSTATPFERVELQMLVDSASFLAPFFQQSVERDRLPVKTSVATAALIRKTLDGGQSLSTLALMRLFFAMKATAQGNRYDRISESGIPSLLVPEANIVVERPQVEALLLLARQSPTAVSMFANITEDPRLLQLARAYNPRIFASERTRYLQFTDALDVDLRAITSENTKALSVDVSQRKPLPTPVVAALAASLAGGLLFGVAKLTGRA